MNGEGVNPNFRTLKRRANELAATTCADEDAQALLFFYAAECALKALYMLTYSLKVTSDCTTVLASAQSFGHRLDQLISTLKIAPKEVPPRPTTLRLRTGVSINVNHLHEAWRYGEKIQNHAEAVAWLNKIIAFVTARL